MLSSFASPKDLDGIANLIESRKKYNLKTNKYFPFREVNNYEKILKKPFQSYGEHRIVISKDDNGVLMLIEQLLLPSYPSWLLFGQIARPGTSFYNSSKNGLSAVLSHACEYAESLRYYQYEWFHVAGKKYFNRYTRTIDQIPVLQRYDHYVVGYIPANAKSQWSRINIMLNFLGMKSYTMVLRNGILRQEYRKYSPL